MYEDEKFTPGPWVTDCPYGDENGVSVWARGMRIALCGHGKIDIENARLISRAPSMLHTLKIVAKDFSGRQLPAGTAAVLSMVEEEIYFAIRGLLDKEKANQGATCMTCANLGNPDISFCGKCQRDGHNKWEPRGTVK